MRSRRSKRGVGAILAASFMLLILVLGFSVFLVIQGQMGDFQESVGTVNALEFERARERLIILGSPNSSLTSDRYLNLTVENQGFVDVRILFVGIFNTTVDAEVGGTRNYSQVYRLGSAPTPATSILVNPGETVKRISHPLNLTVTQNATVDFTIQLVTARGSVATVFVSEGSFASGGQGQPGPPGPPGEGFGLPWTLLMDMSSTRPAFGSSGTHNTTFYIYATNISGDNMTDLVFHLSADQEICKSGNDEVPCDPGDVVYVAYNVTVVLWNGTTFEVSPVPDGTDSWKVDLTTEVPYIPKGETIVTKWPFDITITGDFLYVVMLAEGAGLVEDSGDPVSTNDAIISIYRT